MVLHKKRRKPYVRTSSKCSNGCVRFDDKLRSRKREPEENSLRKRKRKKNSGGWSV
jgi:hypothetical protein